MNAQFSTHALERLAQRGISEADVLDAIANPDNRTFEEDLEVFQKLVGSHLLRVFVNPSKRPPLVVTCYRTSQIKKHQ